MLERSLVLVKPDGVQRALVGEIIKRFEQRALKLIAVKMLVPNDAQVSEHYIWDEEWAQKTGMKAVNSARSRGEIVADVDPLEAGKVIRQKLIDTLKQQPVIAMVWEGYHAVEVIRATVGGTEPRTAVAGTIRGDYSGDSYALSDLKKRSVRNLVHASDSVKNAEREIKVWFKEDEIIKYDRLDSSAAH